MRFVNPNNPNQYYTMPAGLLVLDKYKIKPDSRTELVAYRDGTNYLRRTTSPHHKSKIEFYTKPEMTQTEKEEWEVGASVGLIDGEQRKYCVKFWNNSMGVNAYQTGEFYFADVEFVMTDIRNGEPCYASTRYSLTQY